MDFHVVEKDGMYVESPIFVKERKWTADPAEAWHFSNAFLPDAERIAEAVGGTIVTREVKSGSFGGFCSRRPYVMMFQGRYLMIGSLEDSSKRIARGRGPIFKYTSDITAAVGFTEKDKEFAVSIACSNTTVKHTPRIVDGRKYLDVKAISRLKDALLWDDADSTSESKSESVDTISLDGASDASSAGETSESED